MAICPYGHYSATDDYCDVCGQSTALSSGSDPGRAGGKHHAGRPGPAAGPSQSCPRCGAVSAGQFCERCGLKFRARRPFAPLSQGELSQGELSQGEPSQGEPSRPGSAGSSAWPVSWSSVPSPAAPPPSRRSGPPESLFPPLAKPEALSSPWLPVPAPSAPPAMTPPAAAEAPWAATEAPWTAPEAPWTAPEAPWTAPEAPWTAPEAPWTAPETSWGAAEITRPIPEPTWIAPPEPAWTAYEPAQTTPPEPAPPEPAWRDRVVPESAMAESALAESPLAESALAESALAEPAPVREPEDEPEVFPWSAQPAVPARPAASAPPAPPFSNAPSASPVLPPARAPVQPVPPPAPSAPSAPHVRPNQTAPPTTPIPVFTPTTWTAVVSTDRDYYDLMQEKGVLFGAPIAFPVYTIERRFPLSGSQLRIGRRSAARGLEPEIDLADPPADPGVSRLHAILIAAPNGTWAVLDPGSANGTMLNGRELAVGEMVTLHDGDRINLGAWTAITVQRG
jgi:hypothetical protein